MRGLISALAFAAVALVAQPVRADCSVASFDRARTLVEGFMFEQGSLLRDYPRGGPGMRYRVSAIVASSKAAVPQILRAISAGNMEQRQAAGAGMALAARLCEKKQQAAAARWIEKTAKTYNDPGFLREFDKFYKSREDAQAEVDDAIRAASLRKQMEASNAGSGDRSAVGRSIGVPLHGDLKSVRPIQQIR